MYNIIICEDNYSTAITLKKIITEYFDEKKLDYTVKLFTDRFERIIDFAKCNIENINIYFFDIYKVETIAFSLQSKSEKLILWHTLFS